MKHRHLLMIFILLVTAATGLVAATTPCLTFDGNDYVTVGNPTSLHVSNITLECKAYLNSFSTRPHIVGRGGGNDGAWYIVVESSGEVKFYFCLAPSGAWQIAPSGTWHTTANAWHHYAATYDGTVAKLYVDGVERGTKTVAGTLRTSHASYLTFGHGYALSPGYIPTTGPTNGSIDEVRIWNYARTQQQIQDNMDYEISPLPTTGLVGYWKFNENTGMTAYDSSGNGNHGTLAADPRTPSWGIGDVTLPVELSSFTAVLSAHNNVVLTWITQSETGVMGFYVYRGMDSSLVNAQQISHLIDATNTSDQQVYVFTDSEINQIGTYYYWLMAADIDGSESFHGPILVTYESPQPGSPVIPVLTGLKQVYPNPFNPNTNISYELKEASDVLISIYNSRGQEVRSFERSNVAAGSWKLTWDGKDQNGTGLSSGVYYIRMQAGADSFFKKAVLMK